MNKYVINGQTLTDIAESIRNKTGRPDPLTPSEMATEISGISGEGGQELVDSILDKSVEALKSNVERLDSLALQNCRNLKEIEFPKIKVIGAHTLLGCISLSTIDAPLIEEVGTSSFYGCSSLSRIDFPLLRMIYLSAFAYCTALETVILRRSKICDLVSSSAFNDTPITSGIGYIYVPKSLVEEYKQATNWTTYADQIRAIEDYPEITGGGQA